MNNYERQYYESLLRIMRYGVREKNRTVIDTFAVQNQQFVMEDILNNFPILKGKKMFPKLALKEIVWFMQGRTDIEWLNKHKVTYWDEWKREDGTIGKSYGYQWRNFNGTDQLTELVKGMLYNPTSRRHIVTLWNPSDLKDMALPPCLYDYHFCCVNDIEEPIIWVDLHTTMRSNDSFLGLPYNLIGSAWVLTIICDMLNKTKESTHIYVPRNIYHTSHDYHLYENHYDAARQYIANFLENKDGVISDRKYVLQNFDVEAPQYNNVSEYVDGYLRALENVMSTSSIKLKTKGCNSDFEYGKIEADVAV